MRSQSLSRLTVLICLVLGVFLSQSAEAGRTRVVAQRHPKASDDGPGTAEQPFKTISRAAKDAQAGDSVRVEEGEYREAIEVTADGTAEQPILFAAAPGARVIVTGADVLTDWKREEGSASVWSTPWPHVFIGHSPRNIHPDDDYHVLIGRAEQVFVNRYALQQVATRGELSRGTFFVDREEKRLVIQDRTNQDLVKARLHVEASVRPQIWQTRGRHVHLSGLRFRYAANRAQQGAVILQGDGDRMEDCLVEEVNGAGASFGGKGIVVSRCTFRDNGQLGFASARSDNLTMTGCLCENNNTKNFNRDWEAGGNKLALCKNAVLEKSIFRNNHGIGIWFDIGNEDCVVRNCLIADNDDAGIFYEISYRLHAHDNVIVGNGLAPRSGAWGSNGGIALSSSSGCRVERNLLIGNREGFQFREQGRTTTRIGKGRENFAIWNHDHVIDHNLIAWNRDIQVGGWFDLADGSYKPRAARGDEAKKAGPTELATDIDSLKTKPTGLALEDLHLDLHDNRYALNPGQQLYQWGAGWRQPDRLGTLADVQRVLGLERGSSLISLTVADWSKLDLRLPAGTPAAVLECYPRGEVPGVQLGVVGAP